MNNHGMTDLKCIAMQAVLTCLHYVALNDSKDTSVAINQSNH